MTAVRKNLMILVALAALLALVGCTREITYVEQSDPGPSSCFECHSDQDPFLVSMSYAWANSRHASGIVVARSTRSSCSPCHSTEGFIQVASGGEPEGFDNPTVIHCFACHEPHSEGDFGLRVDDPKEIQDGTVYDIGSGNLCMHCHQGRRDVNSYVSEPTRMSRYFGPHHGPQGDMLYASNGYEYDGVEYGDKPFHRSMTDDGCVDCHFKFSNTYAVGGHSFNMRSMDEEEGDTILNLASCTDCHGELDDFNYNNVQTEIMALADQLNTMLQAAGLLDDSNHALSVTTSADSAGAVFNYLYVIEDRSWGVHNSDYARDLLTSAIDFLTPPAP